MTDVPLLGVLPSLSSRAATRDPDSKSPFVHFPSILGCKYSTLRSKYNADVRQEGQGKGTKRKDVAYPTCLTRQTRSIFGDKILQKLVSSPRGYSHSTLRSK